MAISCSTILYRAILKRSWLDPDNRSRLKADAFFRRPPRKKGGEVDPGDHDGLSVFIASDQVTPEYCAGKFKICQGVASLHAGRLLDLGLTIADDVSDSTKALNQQSTLHRIILLPKD